MKISILEYFYNVILVISIVDLFYCYYLIKKNKDLIPLLGLNNITKIKLIIEKILLILYIAYWIYKIFFI